MSSHRPLSEREKTWLAVALTCAAGFVDAVGYLTLYHVFTANMSGNSVAFGLNAAKSSWQQAFHRGFPVLMFVTGVVVGGLIVEIGNRLRWRRVLVAALVFEIACLVIATAFATKWPQDLHARRPQPAIAVMIAFSAIAMGVQNTSVRKVGALAVHTVHVTGELTKLGEELIAFFFWFHDWVRRPDRPPRRRSGRFRRVLALSWRQKNLQEALVLTLLWCVYVLGAAGATLGLKHWHQFAMLLPIGVLVLVAIIDLFRPVTVGK